jgi:guanylate kinase
MISPLIKGNLFIVAAPSGAGKSSLVNALVAIDPKIWLSISHTTRPPRQGEEEGREYFFLTVDEFKARQRAGEFLESAQVYGNFYGTSRKQLEKQLQAGFDVVLEIDWQGAQQVRSQFREAVGIFILPPSMEVLRQRLTHRGTDSPEVVERRLAAASEDIRHEHEFDYAIINQDFTEAARDLAAIVRAHRCLRERARPGYAGLFNLNQETPWQE